MTKKYSIGDVSKKMNIPIKALRNYDAIGLLKPFYIDENTNYRYYSYDQFFYIDLIRYLNRTLYVPLEDIKRMLNEDRTSSTMLSFLNSHKNMIENKISELEYSKKALTKVIQDINNHVHHSNIIFEQYYLRRNIYVKEAHISIFNIDSFFLRNEEAFKSASISEGKNMCYVYNRANFEPYNQDLSVEKVGVITDEKIPELNYLILPEGRYLCCRFRYSEKASIETLSDILQFAKTNYIKLANTIIQTFNILDLTAASKYDYEMEFQIFEENIDT